MFNLGLRTGAVLLMMAAGAAQAADALPVGEYACFGVGGRIMIGLGFKVTSPGRYTDLDGGNSGHFVLTPGSVTFQGGHLDGQVGRELKNSWFRIGAQAACERLR